MDFQLTSEQEMLRESVSGALARAVHSNDRSSDAEARIRRELAALGVPGLLLAEAAGGTGLGAVEAVLAVAEAGRYNTTRLIPETLTGLPVLATVYPEAVADVLEGKALISAPASGLVKCSARRLTGEIVVAADALTNWLVTPLPEGKVAVLPMPAAGSRGAEFDPCIAQHRLALDSEILPKQVIDAPDYTARLDLLRAADIYGAARQGFEMSVQYLKDRSQFGRPIGANQALKHMAAECFVQVENMRVALEYAACALDAAKAGSDERQEAENACLVVNAYVPETARKVIETAIQLHGGIGATWDLPLNGQLRRILRMSSGIGPADRYRRRWMDNHDAKPDRNVDAAAAE